MKKYLPILLALCQDVDVCILKENIPIIPGRKKERFILGSKINVQNIIFGEEAAEIEKISKIVNNLLMQVNNHISSSSGLNGYLEDIKISIIKQIAEIYQDVALFLMMKRVCPEWGFVVEEGFMHKIIDEEDFDLKLREENRKIRASYKSYLEACERNK